MPNAKNMAGRCPRRVDATGLFSNSCLRWPNDNANIIRPLPTIPWLYLCIIFDHVYHLMAILFDDIWTSLSLGKHRLLIIIEDEIEPRRFS